MMKINKPIALAVALAATVAASVPVASAMAATADVSAKTSNTAPNQASLSRRRETLSYAQGDQQIVVQAGWVSGDGFSLMAITNGYTTRAGSIVTISANDGSATLRIERMVGVAPKDAIDAAKSPLAGKGFNQFANNKTARSGDTPYRMVATGSGIRANVLAMSAGNDTVLVTETYKLDSMTEQEPAIAAMRDTLAIQSGRKPAPTPTPAPSTKPIGSDPRTWSPSAEIRYRVGDVTHEAPASKTISDMGYVMYMLGGYEYVGGNGYDVFQRKNGNAFLTVYTSMLDAQTSLDQQAAYLTKQGYTEDLAREVLVKLNKAHVATLTQGDNVLRVTTIENADGGCYVLRESFAKKDATAKAEMRGMIGTFVQY